MHDDIHRFIDEALGAIPERFRREMRNLAFVVEDGYGPECDCECADCDAGELLGLYEGVPLIEREGRDDGLLPDKITLFAASIREEAEECGLSVAQVTHETVWHEVAHFFGFDEDKAEELEGKWAEALEAGNK